MTRLEMRLAKLERAQGSVELPLVRIFTCWGDAEDGGPCLADSVRPVGTPLGFVWAMTVCGCAADGLSGCRYPNAHDPKRFTITIDRAEDLASVENS
jgi:hypothetical protein